MPKFNLLLLEGVPVYTVSISVIDTKHPDHYGDVIMGAMASQITSLTIVYSTVYSDADQRKHQSFASLAFLRWIHRGPVNSLHKWPVTRKMFPFDNVIMLWVGLLLIDNTSFSSIALLRYYFSAKWAPRVTSVTWQPQTYCGDVSFL